MLKPRGSKNVLLGPDGTSLRLCDQTKSVLAVGRSSHSPASSPLLWPAGCPHNGHKPAFAIRISQRQDRRKFFSPLSLRLSPCVPGCGHFHRPIQSKNHRTGFSRGRVVAMICKDHPISFPQRDEGPECSRYVSSASVFLNGEKESIVGRVISRGTCDRGPSEV